MKDKQNVILILVSLSKFKSLFWRFIKILGFNCSSFFSGVPSFLGYIIAKLHLIIARLQPCSLQTFNSFMLSFPIRSSSWRPNMVAHQEFLSFFIRSSQSRPVISWRPSQVYAISLLILAMGISSMPNPLLVSN